MQMTPVCTTSSTGYFYSSDDLCILAYPACSSDTHVIHTYLAALQDKAKFSSVGLFKCLRNQSRSAWPIPDQLQLVENFKR